MAGPSGLPGTRRGPRPDSPLDRLRPRSVVVVRALPGLGDMLCAVPALRALRGALPEARITLLTLPAVMPLMERFPELADDLLAFPGWPGLPEVPLDPAAVTAFLGRVQGRRYDLALQLHGNGMRTRALVELLGARHAGGYFLPGVHSPDDGDGLWREYPGRGHEVDILLDLVSSLGAPDLGRRLAFPVRPFERGLAARLLAEEGLEAGRFALIHAGAKHAARRWPPARFAAVADHLSAAGLAAVLTGTKADAALSAAVARHTRSRPHDLTGRTGIGLLAALLEQAAITVCNDTGVSHLAAAVGAPSVVVFSGSDPARWAPQDEVLHRPVGPLPLHDRPGEITFDTAGHCLRDACLLAPDPSRRQGPPVSAVLDAVRSLLDQPRRRTAQQPHSA